MIPGRPRQFPRLLALGFVVAGTIGCALSAPAVDHGALQTAVSERPSEESSPETRVPVEATTLSAVAAREHLMSGLLGSKHDFTRNGAGGRDLCTHCHTPHLTSGPPALLSRRSDSTQPLRPYRCGEIELTGWSLLCLGCHDGVAAPSVYSSAHAATIADQFTGSNLGTAGPRGHPVGVKYPLVGEDYHTRAAVEAHGLALPDGRVQCTTCHDAHNTHRHPGMLRRANERSQVCLTCHRR